MKETRLKPPTPSHDCMRVLPHHFLLESTKCCVFCTLGESCFSQSQSTTHNFGDKKTNQKTLSTFFGGEPCRIFCFESFLAKPKNPKINPWNPKNQPLESKVRYVQEQSKKTIHAVFRGIGPFGPIGCSQLAPATIWQQQRQDPTVA